MFARQRTKLAFFKHSSYEMLREIAIPYYYIKILHYTLYHSYVCRMYVYVYFSVMLLSYKNNYKKNWFL